LRLALVPQDGKLAVHVLKRRGGEVARPVLIDIENGENGVRLTFHRSLPHVSREM